jgi:GDP-4-dehydro-6-deoxy-D-mannose reductase
MPVDVPWLQADLLDRQSVTLLPSDTPLVLHLASETVPSRFSSLDPLLDSVEMTMNLCRHLRSGRLLFASSCLVYGTSREPLAEDDPLDPRGNYGLAKMMSERVVARTPNIEYAIARPFNHVGVGMRPDLVIPSIIRRVRDTADGDLIHMTGLDSIRDFVSVEDIVAAYFDILTAPRLHNTVYNVSSGHGTSIGEIVRIVARICGKPIGGVSFSEQGNSADDTSLIVGDSSRLKSSLGWTARSSLEDSLRKLAAAAI